MTVCVHCGKSFNEALYHGCNQYPCVPGGGRVEPVGKGDIQEARQKITDVKNTLQVSGLVQICGYSVEDLVSTLEDSISHLNGDSV